MVRIAFILLALMSVCLISASVNVESVNATDISQTGSQVTISLSEGSLYTVQRSSGAYGIRIVIPFAKVNSVVPNYPRLSQVLDTITAYKVGTSAVIDIRIMSDLLISHSANADKTLIMVTINTPSAPQSKTAIAAPKPHPPVSANPAPSKQLPTKITPPVPADTATTPVWEAGTTLPPPPVSDKLPQPKKQIKRRCPYLRASQLVILIAVFTMLLALVIIKIYFSPKAKAKNKKDSERKLEGTTLLLDSETRTRMVHRLLDQSWTAGEIAREMKLGVRDVEQIIAFIQSSGYDRES